jgi:hypothetical protein
VLISSCLSDFADWSRYPSIAALSINLGIDDDVPFGDIARSAILPTAGR